MKIAMALPLSGTPCKQDYSGSGWGWLVIKDGLPQKLIYHPEREQEGMPEDWQVVINIDPENSAEIDATTEVWFGMASCWEFCGIMKL